MFEVKTGKFEFETPFGFGKQKSEMLSLLINVNVFERFASVNF